MTSGAASLVWEDGRVAPEMFFFMNDKFRAGGSGPAAPAMVGPLFSQNGCQSTYFFKIFQGEYHSRTTSIRA